ncbi:RNA helicase [Aphelenchoides avenae]|nr:RNA helicase [Aphelenchus avenae]
MRLSAAFLILFLPIKSSRPGSVLSSILRQNGAASRQSPEKSKHRIALPEEFDNLAAIARNTRNGEIDEGALQMLEAEYGRSSIRGVVKSTPETLEQWREWIRHYGWMLLAQSSIEKTTLLMYNARIERAPPTENARFRYRITFPRNFKYNERLDSMAAIQICDPGHDPSNSAAKVASVEQVHPRYDFMYVSFSSGPLSANEQWVDVFSMSSTLLPDGILNGANRLTEGECSLLHPNFIAKESLHEFIGRRENSLSRTQHNVVLNTDQKRAVFSMLYDAYPEYPFILRGPPGTGKSEAVLEVLKATLTAGNKVLLCAQSSVPVEDLAKRCLEAGIRPEQVIYLQARGKPVEKRDRALDGIVYVRYKVVRYNGGRRQEVPDEGVGITPQREQQGRQPVFVMPPLGILDALQPGHLHDVDRGASHQSGYVVVEDAGKVTEPELAMVVTGLKGPRAKLLLVGDPNLSGPVVRPSVLQKSAYEVSTFKRLTSFHGYASGNPDPRLTATLTVNYRNAHTILKLARPFYGNLERHARSRTTEWLHYLKDCKVLPEASNVVFFDAQTYVNSSARLKPAQQQRGLNASQSNKAEAVAVYKMVCLLLAVEGPDGNYLFEEDDIGVIVPYKNQVSDHAPTDGAEHVQQSGSGHDPALSGDAEANRYRLDYANGRPRSFEVQRAYTTAVMRAMDLLIVIGDRATLSGRKCPWRSVIELCEEHGTVMPHFDPSVDGWLNEQAQEVLRDYVDVVVP